MQADRIQTRAAQRLASVIVLGALAWVAAPAEAEVSVLNSFDADSYIFFGTSNVFTPEVSVGLKLSGEDAPHFNFGVIAFDDFSAFGPADNKYLRFEIDAYAITEVVDQFPTIELTTDGQATLKLVALEMPYADYLAASDKLDWFDTTIGDKPAVATADVNGAGVFDVNVTDAVNDWIGGGVANFGFGLVLTSGDPIEIGSREGGNGAVLTDTALALPGDTDGDGDIDDTDLGTSFSNYTGPVGGAGGKVFSDGDTDGDGDVDDTDLGSAFVGYTGPLSPSSIPEPGSLVLLAFSGLLVSRRRVILK